MIRTCQWFQAMSIHVPPIWTFKPVSMHINAAFTVVVATLVIAQKNLAFAVVMAALIIAGNRVAIILVALIIADYGGGFITSTVIAYWKGPRRWPSAGVTDRTGNGLRRLATANRPLFWIVP